MSLPRTVLLTCLGLLLAGLMAAGAVVGFGLYPVAATREHFQFVYGLLETSMRHAVQRAARNVEVPELSDPALVQRGAQCYRQHCVQCHGAPGVAQGDIGRGMQPVPGPLVDATQRWNTREIYWITRHGIRMSGMPAWQYRLPERDLWALARFVETLPALGPADYARMTALAQPAAAGAATVGHAAWCGFSAAERDAVPSRLPDERRGRDALSQYACTACHSIPGVTSSSPHVGPPLGGLARRDLIAGRLANTPQNMVRWLRDPRSVDPATAMPDLQVTEADARDIAAYLATLR